jgi:hypothetical protein
VYGKGQTGNFNNSDATPDHAESEAVIRQVASLFENMRRS